jgi:hypothetical protein
MNPAEKEAAVQKAKGTIVEAIMDELFGSADEYVRKESRKLVRRNSSMHKNDQMCFTHKGRLYEMEEQHGQRYPRPINLAHPSLRDDIDEFDLHLEKLEREKATVKSFLQVVALQCASEEDFRSILPGSLMRFVTPLAEHLSDESTLKDSETLLSQYEKYHEALTSRMTLNLLNAR